MNVTTSNCSNNYGPYHFPEKLIPLVIINILHGKALPIYGDGKNIRDWLYVEDHARGIERVLGNGKSGETYNIGGVNEWTNIDIVNLVCNLIDQRFESDSQLRNDYPDCPASNNKSSDSLISYVTDRAGHDFRYAIDTTRIKLQTRTSVGLFLYRRRLIQRLPTPDCCKGTWLRKKVRLKYRAFCKEGFLSRAYRSCLGSD